MQDGPLGDEELDTLADFLMSDATGEEAMDISMLDGYLTALAIGPNNLPPSTWMPQVWGEGMEWQSRELADRMISLVFRQANDILFYLRDEPESFVPLLYDHEVEGTTVTVIDEWCAGFVAAMALDEDGWRPMLETEAGATLLHPIMLYGTEAGWEELEADPELAARHDEIVASLGEIVMAVQAWWLPERKANSTVRHEQPGDQAKVGRDEPCPCGSGKKFKVCCGGERMLH